MSRESKLHTVPQHTYQPPQEQLKGTKELAPYDASIKDVFMLPIQGEMGNENLAVFLDHFIAQTAGPRSYALLLHINENRSAPVSIRKENDLLEEYVLGIQAGDMDKIEYALQDIPQSLRTHYLRIANQLITSGCRIDYFRSTHSGPVHFGRLRNELIHIASTLISDPSLVVGHFIDVDTPLRHSHIETMRKTYEDPENPVVANISDHDLLPAISKETEVQEIDPERFDEFNDMALRSYDMHRLVEYMRHVWGIQTGIGFPTNTPTISARFSVLTSKEVNDIFEASSVQEDYLLAKYLFDTYGRQCGSTGLVYYGRPEVRLVTKTHGGDAEDRAQVNLGFMNGIVLDPVGDVFETLMYQNKGIAELPQLQSYYMTLDITSSEFTSVQLGALKAALMCDIPQLTDFFELFKGIPEAQMAIEDKLRQFHLALQRTKSDYPHPENPMVFANAVISQFGTTTDSQTAPVLRLPQEATTCVRIMREVAIRSWLRTDQSLVRAQVEGRLNQQAQEAVSAERRVIEKRKELLRDMVSYHLTAQKTGEEFPLDRFRYAEPYYRRYHGLADLSLAQKISTVMRHVIDPSITIGEVIARKVETEFPDLFAFTDVHDSLSQLKAIRQLVFELGPAFSLPIKRDASGKYE